MVSTRLKNERQHQTATGQRQILEEVKNVLDTTARPDCKGCEEARLKVQRMEGELSDQITRYEHAGFERSP